MVAGGYVVLERPNPALVAAVSARVYSVVAPLADSAGVQSKKEGTVSIEIEVLSPQMEQSRRYVVTCDDKGCSLERTDNMDQNPYVEATLINTMSFIVSRKGASNLRPFSASIHGDNAFYVMENEVSRSRANDEHAGVRIRVCLYPCSGSP
jgi:phosphomevalonate kinase